jgi:hypothetical protein
MATLCKALRKPTEQPIEQWDASLVGKVPTKYLSKGCGYGFQKRRKSKLCGHGLEIKRERLNLPKLYHGRKSPQNYVMAENVDAPIKTRQDTLNGCGNQAQQKIDQKE